MLMTGPPTVATGAASAITLIGATLNGTVNPNGSTTTALFQYSTSPTFTPTVETIVGSGFSGPLGVAVDSAGDVFVADSGNNLVKEVLPSGVINTIGSGFDSPTAVAVDAAGDVFVADSLHNAVKEVEPNGTILTIGSGFDDPLGVAVDGAGDVFVSDSGHNAVKEVEPNGTILTIGSGFNSPRKLALDAAGDVFVSDYGHNAVKEVLPNGTINTIGSGFDEPVGVAVDAAGDVFVGNAGNNLVQEVLTNGTILTIGSGFNAPRGVAVDAAGDVFVADSNNSRIVEVSPPTVAATPSPLSGTTATAVSATLTGLTSSTTYYDRGVATNAGGMVAASAGSFTTLTPPTAATGAASSIMFNGATLSATVNPNGSTTTALFQYSTSPLFTPTVASTVGSGYNQPVGVAVDAAGDVFVSDIGTNAVYEVLPSGTIKTIGSGFNTPRGVAVDAYGDVFVADYGNNAVKEVQPNGTITTIGSGFNGPYSVAVDAAGDVYVADFNNNAVKEVVPNLGSRTFSSGYTINTIASISAPRGVAVDAHGDVFVATYVNSAVYEVLTSGTINTIGYGFNQPRAVAVDAAGDVFVADSGNNAVYEVLAGGTTFTIGSGYAFAAGVAVDATGDVFVADRDNERVNKLSPPAVAATPSSLTGTTAMAVSAKLTGLFSQVIYYDRVVATKPGGAVVASDTSFFTVPPPTVATGAASAITATGATLNATVNPQGSTTTALFQYSTSPTFTPTVATTIGSGFSGPTGVAVGAGGDVYVADPSNQEVYEVLPNGTISTFGIFTAPTGIAVDAAGDVFLADTSEKAVREFGPGGSLSQVIGTGFSGLQGVALDAAGDVFVADTGNNAVKEVLPNGAILTIGSGFKQPRGVAVDAAGDVFVADTGNNAVKEVLPSGTINTIGSGFSTPTGVAVNAAGDVFVADSGNNAVKEVLPNGTILTLGSGFKEPSGVALDPAGDVFVADTGNSRVVELSPPTVTATPSTLTGTTATAVSATLTGLTPGTTYYDRVVATSAGGTVADTSTGSFTTSQSAPTPTATSVAPSTATVSYGQSATFTATVSSSAGVPPDGSVQFLVNGVAYGSPVALSGATAQLAISEPAGSYTIAAQYTGDANYAATLPAAETSGTLIVDQASTATSVVTPSNLITLASFDSTDGSVAAGGVIRDAAGNLFGTTGQGGPSDAGTVFEVAAGSGAITTLASFDGANGQDPNVGLIEDASGDLFGVTAGGGNASNDGTVFEVAAGSHAITTLALFSGTNGANPNGTLIEDGSGNLFGTTELGGASNDGTVFEVAAGSHAITTLASFNGADGFEPFCNLVEDGSGNLFGAATDGGAYDDGDVFEVAAGSGAITTLASFNGANGQWPQGGLIMDGSGNLFGTTYTGGADSDGTVFEVAAVNHAITTLASFNGANGQSPLCRLVEDGSGDLFGTAIDGGASNDGTLFEVAAGSGAITALASFNGANGQSPEGDLVEGGGNLYGTAALGGANGDGTVFEYQIGAPTATVSYGQSATFTATVSSAAGVPPDGSVQFLVNGAAYGSPVALSGAKAQLAISEPAGSYTIAAEYTGDANYAVTVAAAETTGTLTVNRALTATSVMPSSLINLASFDYTDGSFATSGVISDAAGDLFGTTSQGASSGDGTVFEVAAGSGTITTLATFNGTNGQGPRAGLLMDASGDLFGTTYGGGSASDGTVFEVVAGTHALITLATFTGSNGANPSVALIADRSGDLFGTTQYGGASNDGTVFEVAAGTHALTTLASFNGANGLEPVGTLVEDSKGDLFGAATDGGAYGDGDVFEVAAGSHTITVLASFNGTNGQWPGDLITDGSGNLFGVTWAGGASSDGTVFEVAAGSNAITSLASFTGGASGLNPSCELVEDGSGNLFGTTYNGGASNDGTLFEVAAGSHTITTLASFNGANGQNPQGDLIESGGNLYSTTAFGGASGYGTVFEYQLAAQTGTVSYGQSVTFTATVSSSAGVPPDGSVQFLVNGAAYGSPVALSGATAQLAISEPAGSYTIAVQYTGDANYAVTLPAAETTATFTVNQAATDTAVTPSTATVSYGQSVTFTATVSSSAGVPPDGSVQFLVNGAAYGSPVALSGATAQVAISEPAGSYTIAAEYTGDANYAATLPAAETTASLTVNQVATDTAVTPGTATIGYGQSATFTATVSSSAGVPPDGSVQFLVNGAAYGSPVALSGATAQLAISEPVGNYTIAAQYTGDANYAATLPAAETTASLTVSQAATDTAVTPGTATVSYGQSATFTATVSSPAGVPPGGSVQFLVNGAAYGSPVALSGATAQVAISEPAGSYTIAAEYTGDANYAATLPAAETTASLTVNQVATDTAVTPGTATIGYGQSATFTATVSSSAGVPPDGSVQFLVNGAAYGSPVALSGATAQLAISEPVGNYTIAAQYTGDANYAATLPAAETSASLTVNLGGSQTSLQSSENPSNFGDSVTFTATVSSTSSASGLATPTGQVEFFDGSTLLDTATLSGGAASYTTSSLLVGANQQIEAAYLGDSNYNPSNVTIEQTVNPPVTDFWTGASAAHGGNDDWSNPGNWALGAPPTSVETADFTASESQYSKSVVDIPFSIVNLTIDSTWGGTVSANASLTISGNLTLASGTFGGNGAVSIAGAGSQYTGGSLGGNITDSGTLTIAGSQIRTFSGTLTNTGTIQVSAGSGNANTITGTVVNEGLIALASNEYLYISGNYYAAGGSITGLGYLYNTALYVTASPTAGTTILLEGTGNTLETNNLANTTLWVQGNGYVGNAVLNVANGTVNDGTILLESQNSNYNDTLATGSGTLTNAADGTIQVTEGTGGGRTISGTVVNQGQIDVGSNTGLAVSGTLENQGQVAVSSYTTISGTYEYDGGSITGPGYLANCALDFTVNPTAPTTFLLEGSGDALPGADIPAQATLWVQGNGDVGNAVLNVANGTVNDGTILLESQNTNYNDTLATGSGTFTNAADGTIQVTEGTGGGRTISGTVVNQGQIDVGSNTGLTVSGTLENQGQVAVSSYTTISGTYEYDGGSITGPGYLDNCALDFLVNPTAPTTLLLEGSGDSLSGADIPAQATLWVQGNGDVGNAVLNVANGTVNDGTILLESQNTNYDDTLATGSGTFTNAADGTIQVTEGTGGGRTISGTVVNQGQIDVGSNTGLTVSGTLENQGQVAVSSYTTISGTYEYDGGSITGPGYLDNCALDFLVNPTAPTTLLLEGSGDSLSGADIPAQATLWVQGNGDVGNAVLNVANGTVNDGTILLESQNTNYDDTLATGSGTFTNAADGTIQVTEGTGGGRTISGTVVNQGQIDVGSNTGLTVSGTLENQGQVAVSSYTTISGTYEYDGGSITGPGYLANCALDFVVSPTAATTFLLEGSGDSLSGADIPALATLWVQGNGNAGNAVLNVANGTVNDGTILLESQDSNYADTLATGSGTLTNAADGTIQVTEGTGGGAHDQRDGGQPGPDRRRLQHGPGRLRNAGEPGAGRRLLVHDHQRDLRVRRRLDHRARLPR